jgi:hypothetical protein
MMFTNAFILAGGLATLAEAHIKMRIPTPYATPEINNGPLATDGSNFPCQSTGTFSDEPGASVKKGSSFKLGFTGEATHSGGSCQVSINYDNPPTKDSTFKVLHTIYGGCPGLNGTGHVGGDGGGDAAAVTPGEYDVTIPEDLPAGKATIAWSWMNKSGITEFYMNCAPITVEGEGGSESALEALPNMFITNVAPHTACTNPMGSDIEYPNPGTSVDSSFGPSLAPPEGDCSAQSGASGAGGGSGAKSATPAATPAVRGRTNLFRA